MALASACGCAGIIGADFERPEGPLGELDSSNQGGSGGSSSSSSGGSASSASGGNGGEPVDASDTTPPTIVSVVPEDDATGIGSERAIVVEFSEPMSQAITAAAFRSEQLPAGSVAFEWNADGTVLSVSSPYGLPYAAGAEDVKAVSIEYSFSGAKDLAGNALDSATYSFSTMRHIVYALEPAYLGCIKLLDGVYSTSSSDQAGGGGNPSLDNFRGVVEFDIESLPQFADPEMLLVHLDGALTDITPANALHDYGPLSIGRIADTTTAETRFTSMESEPALGYVSQYGFYSVDVSSSFRADYLQRTELGNALWYGYYFENFETGHVARAGITASLRVEYLRP